MARQATRKKAAYRKKLQNRFSMFLVTMVVLVLLVVVGIRAYGLTQKREELLTKQAEIEALIEKEKQEAIEIEEYGKYTQTLKFYEEMAKKKLGLVYEDEIIFIQED
ncbi:MAG: septum formation initiator family protein [Lachnospiraceae bacterium]|nr:septum formation initiator family protein [Lachnospiraceae bacterium]